MTSEQIAELRESVRREALPIWATTNGNTETWVTTPGIGLRVTRALRALPRLLDEREALLKAARAIYPEGAPVRTGAWDVRALADAIAKAESP